MLAPLSAHYSIAFEFNFFLFWRRQDTQVVFLAFPRIEEFVEFASVERLVHYFVLDVGSGPLFEV